MIFVEKCWRCENNIEHGLQYGFWGKSNETKPICIKCLKEIIESDGKDFGLKNRLEKWLVEEGISFNWVNEPNHVFHCMLKDEGKVESKMEILQEKNSSEVIVGFMMFLSPELTFKIYRFSKEQKEDFKRKIDEFLSSIKVDYRTGLRVGHEIVSEKGHYGAKYFIRVKENECDKRKLLEMINKVQEVSKRSEEFLSETLA